MAETDTPIQELQGRLSITVSPVDPTVTELPEKEEGEIIKENQLAPEDLSPSSQSSSNSASNRPTKRAKDRLPSIARTAVRATKEQFWDSNEPGIIVAQNAVDRWEDVYVWVRNVVVAGSHAVANVYDASKSGARGLDKGLLVPVRDYVLLPTFGFAEHVVGSTCDFITSSEALEGSADFVSKNVPFGDTVVLPAVRLGSGTLQKVWEVARYPVPSETTVRNTVEFLLNGSKENLSVCGREIVWYVKRADANIARTLRRTQWVVLGSGPYETLDEAGRREIMDHLCERYLSIENETNTSETSLWIARYEFMSNVRACNRSLYRDLVETGLLKERGGDLTKDDEWLSEKPKYRSSSRDVFLMDHEESDNAEEAPCALWFRLPFENGKRPKKDVPWVVFTEKEGRLLEEKYRSILEDSRPQNSPQAMENRGFLTLSPQNVSIADRTNKSRKQDKDTWDSPKYATEAKWYNPDLENDVLLDQKRHAVTFVTEGQLDEKKITFSWDADRLFALPPPLLGLYRPTMWRSYGPDEIRRAVWFLDTQRNGPQPYGEDAQAVLEDAYQFLKWKIDSKNSIPKPTDTDNTENPVSDDNLNVLLTVQVPSPDSSEQQLVQFSSLTIATAIGKGLGGAISLFKRRVYRGARNFVPQEDEENFEKEEEEEVEPLPIDEDAGFNTTTEEALEKLSLTISIKDSPTGQEVEEASINIEPKESPKGSAEQDESIESEESSLEKTDDPSSVHSNTSKPEDSTSMASQIVYTRKGSLELEDEHREVDHLILVVHGIGEMMQAYDLFGLKKVPTIADCCGYLRENHAEISDAQLCQIETCSSKGKIGRVEYLPVEWHEAFSVQSTRKTLAEQLSSSKKKHRNKVSVDDISLPTIPTMRSFANDTLMDILYFMSPAHHDIIVDIVTFELNFVVERYRKLTGFKGDISVIGHSIGSVIAWDILDNQRNSDLAPPLSAIQEESPSTTANNSYRYPQLDFAVNNMFLLGSPIPVFLMIRNQEKPLTKTFSLNGCPKVFNIFHPYDPVSYRIEPLIHPRNSEIDPEIMLHWNGGFRFQYQTRRLWQKIVDQTLQAEENVIHSLESGIEALGLVDSNGNEIEDANVASNDHDAPHILESGSLNGGRRIDYMLQEKEIDRANEYLAALAAHSCYWLEKDLSLFISNEISRGEER